MKTGKWAKITARMVAITAFACIIPWAVAQGPGGGPGGDGPGGGGGPRFDPAQMQAHMLEMIKSNMETSEEEWTVIEPRLSTVMKLQSEQRRGSMRGMFGMRGRRPGRQNNQAQTEQNAPQPPDRPGHMGTPDPEQEALSTALQNEETTSEEIQAKLKALRAARAKKAEELKKAQEELSSVLTVKQEAQLVLMGILE